MGSMCAGAPAAEITTPRASSIPASPWFVVEPHASVRPMNAGRLQEVVAQREAEFLSELEAMVNIDCGSYSPTGVNRVVDRCAERFLASGWEVDRRAHEPGPGEPQLGDLLIGTLRGAGGPRVLLVGHTDTVFDDGTAAERPFRIEGDRAYGPGVSDMKGGLLSGFFATQALQDAGIDGFGHITYVCNPDEEIGSTFSGPVIRELAGQHDVAYVLEGGRENGDFVSARKGVTDYAIAVHGRAAHAGVEPHKGRNAIAQAAELVRRIHELHDRWPGVSVNVGTIAGGTRTNVVPALCSFEIDLRAPEVATLESTEAEIERICATPTMPDVTIDVHRTGWHRPMEKTPAVAVQVERAIAFAGELGFALRDAATGGASDANTIAAAGTPVIDGLGPIGGDDHSPSEWLEVASIVPRTALVAALIGLA
jgi:glutamate carboxypeptidase